MGNASKLSETQKGHVMQTLFVDYQDAYDFLRYSTLGDNFAFVDYTDMGVCRLRVTQGFVSKGVTVPVGARGWFYPVSSNTGAIRLS